MELNLFWLIGAMLLVGIVVAGLAYYIINSFLSNENRRREIEVRKVGNSQIIPQRLAAYERMALFLERIKPSALIRRVEAISTARNYEALLIQAVQGEWEHNLSQQIYVNPDTWKLIYSAKNATQNFVRECAAEMKPDASARELQEYIVQKSVAEGAPSNGALLKLQVDIQGNL